MYLHFPKSLFMLLLLLLAMGWAVTRQEIRCKMAIFSVWLAYSIVHCLLYYWKRVSYVTKMRNLTNINLLLCRPRST